MNDYEEVMEAQARANSHTPFDLDRLFSHPGLKKFRPERTAKPLIYPIGNNIIGPAAGGNATLIIEQSPSPGRTWFVSRVGLFGVDGHTAVAGAVADIYMGPAQGNVDFTSQVYSGVTIPFLDENGRFHNPMHANETLYALLYGLPASQSVTLVGLVHDYATEDVEAMTI